MKGFKFLTLFLIFIFSANIQSVFGQGETRWQCISSSYDNYLATTKGDWKKQILEAASPFAETAEQYLKNCEAERVELKKEIKRKKITAEQKRKSAKVKSCIDCLKKYDLRDEDYYTKIGDCSSDCVAGGSYTAGGFKRITYPSRYNLRFNLEGAVEDVISDILSLENGLSTPSTRYCYDPAEEGEVYDPLTGEKMKDCSSVPNSYLSTSGVCVSCGENEFPDRLQQSCVSTNEPCSFPSFEMYSIEQADFIRRGHKGSISSRITWNSTCNVGSSCGDGQIINGHSPDTGDPICADCPSNTIPREDKLSCVVSPDGGGAGTIVLEVEPCSYFSFDSYSKDQTELFKMGEAGIIISEEEWGETCNMRTYTREECEALNIFEGSTFPSHYWEPSRFLSSGISYRGACIDSTLSATQNNAYTECRSKSPATSDVIELKKQITDCVVATTPGVTAGYPEGYEDLPFHYSAICDDENSEIRRENFGSYFSVSSPPREDWPTGRLVTSDNISGCFPKN